MRKNGVLMLVGFLALLLGIQVQASEPAWIHQLKLSGLSGPADFRLAIINGKTFSVGEDNGLKVAGHEVSVTCVAIADQSAQIRIEGLPGVYELNLAGEVIPLSNDVDASASVVPVPTKPLPAHVPTSTPVYVPSASVKPITFFPIKPIQGHFFPLLILIGLLVAGLFGFVIGVFAGARTDIFTHSRKGATGEAKVAETIGTGFQRPHLLLNNITLPTTEGTTQIDHVLMTDTGIFVIETKDFSGWIFGRPNDAEWTQSFHRRRFPFQNPLRQNHLHLKTLRSLLDLPAGWFHTVVVFTGNAEFKTDPGPNVVRLSGLVGLLSAERPVVLDEQKMATAIGRIEMKRHPRSIETDEYHVNYLRRRFAGEFTNAGKPEAMSPSSKNPFNASSSDEKYQPRVK